MFLQTTEPRYAGSLVTYFSPVMNIALQNNVDLSCQLLNHNKYFSMELGGRVFLNVTFFLKCSISVLPGSRAPSQCVIDVKL